MPKITHIICPNPDCHRQIPRDARFCPYCGHDAILNNDAPSDDRRYRLTRIIKQGGQGAVYEGIDQDERVYAIKEMLDYFTDAKERAEALQRFNAEAALLQKLTHPRIPRVYSHFTDEGRHYLTMDFVQGEDLEQIVERRGALPESTVLEWADQICDVLDYLHGKGLIYRDMKPSNVMIDAHDGKVKLVDFGIAKLFKPTERGTQIGTPGYAPPEQYQGLATPASDIYALGATLHHLLTGRDPTDHPPFSFPPARDVNVNVSRRTSDALHKALQMKPEERFGSVAEFRAMLRPLAAAQPARVASAPRSTVVIPSVAHPRVASSPSAIPGSSSGRGQSRANAPAAAPPLPLPGARGGKGTAPAQPVRVRSTRRRSLGGCVGQFVGVLLLLVGIAVLATFLLTDLVSRYLPGASSEQPSPAGLTPPRELELEIEVAVAADADADTIRQAFVRAFEERVVQENPGASINYNVPPAPIGQWEAVGRTGDTVTYRATVQGLVQLPRGP